MFSNIRNFISSFKVRYHVSHTYRTTFKLLLTISKAILRWPHFFFFFYKAELCDKKNWAKNNNKKKLELLAITHQMPPLFQHNLKASPAFYMYYIWQKKREIEVAYKPVNHQLHSNFNIQINIAIVLYYTRTISSTVQGVGEGERDGEIARLRGWYNLKDLYMFRYATKNNNKRNKTPMWI